MFRRSFLQLLASLPLVGAIPAVRAAAEPRTVAELERAVEALFAEARDTEPRAYQEMTLDDAVLPPGQDWTRLGPAGEQVSWRVGGYKGPFWRVTPAVFRALRPTEAQAVSVVWRMFLWRLGAHKRGTDTVFWRKRPEAEPACSFETGELGINVRMRVGVRPADWKERALRGEHEWRLPGVPEGDPSPRA